MAERKRQHYVPQFYLRNFSESGQSIGMFRFNNQKFIENASIKEVAYRDYLYGKDGEAEKLLSQMEALWSQAIRALFSDNLLDNDIAELYYRSLELFIMVSITRTAKYADESLTFLNYFKDMFDEIKKNGHKLAIDEADVHRSIEAPNIAAIKMSLELSKYLYNLTPALLVNISNRGFFTSDNPVVEYNQFYAYRKYDRNYGISAAGLQIFLPITSDIVFCLYDNEVYDFIEKDNIVVIKSGSVINEINKLIIENSYEQIFFFNSEKESYVKSMSKYKDYNRNPLIEEYPIEGSNNTLLWYGKNSIRTLFKLPFFKINKEYISIPLPNHMGGLMRKTSKELDSESRKKHPLRSFKIIEE